MGSFHFFFLNCDVNIHAVASFTGTFSVLFQPYSTKRTQSTDISTNTLQVLQTSYELRYENRNPNKTVSLENEKIWIAQISSFSS